MTAAPAPPAWTLEDVEVVHREAPDTFSIPTLARRRALGPGDLVKLVFLLPVPSPDGMRAERMWVKIEHADNGRFHGVIDNAPRYLKAAPGDPVDFELRHVAAVWVDPGDRGWVDPYQLAIVSQAWLAGGSSDRAGRGGLKDGWPIAVREPALEPRDSGWRILPASGAPGRLVTLTLDALERQLRALDTILHDPRSGAWRWDETSAEFSHSDRSPAVWSRDDSRAALARRPAQAYDDDRLAIVSRRVFADGEWPGELVLGERDGEDDSGWQVLAGDESEAYLAEAGHARMVNLGALVVTWPDLDALFEERQPGRWRWDAGAGLYRRTSGN